MGSGQTEHNPEEAQTRVWSRARLCVALAHSTQHIAQHNDLRFGPVTGDMLPRRRVARGAPTAIGRTVQEREGEAAALKTNALHMQAGLMALEREGESAFLASALESTVAISEANRSSVYDGLERKVVAPEERMLFGGTEIGNETPLEINLIGTEAAMKVAGEFGVPKFKTVREAEQSIYWPAIKTAMEEEISGKLGNKSWKVVPRDGKRVMKSKWVIDAKLNDDGSIKS